MELTKMPHRLFAKKLLGTLNPADEQKFRQLIESSPNKQKEFQQIQFLLQEAEKAKIFEQFDTSEDWKAVESRINPYSLNYKRIRWGYYFARIAALVIVTFGLSYGFYRLILQNRNSDMIPEKSHFTAYKSDNQKKDITLPDGSTVTLNASSDLTFREGFGEVTRDVILNGEAFFNVSYNPELPFRVFSGESVIEVTGTSFSVSQSNGEVHVAVLSGTVLLSSGGKQNEKISLKANQSALLSANHDIMIEDGIPVNILSWKTGQLIFDETPMDSALIDIARHFRRELEIETPLNEKITAEFQNQPLYEILGELKLVAGLEFDTTGTALIVKK